MLLRMWPDSLDLFHCLCLVLYRFYLISRERRVQRRRQKQSLRFQAPAKASINKWCIVTQNCLETYTDVFHNKVIDYNCVSCCTRSETDVRQINAVADLSGPFSTGVRQSQDLKSRASKHCENNREVGVIYLVLQAFNASPSAHDENIVCSNDCDDIDTLGLELLVLFNVRREMVHMAGRSESSGDREEHDLLAFPIVRGQFGG